MWRKNQETDKPIDWSNTGSTIKMMLTTSGYTPLLTHTTKTDITNEVVGGSYVARGHEIITASRTVVELSGVVTVDGLDIQWDHDTGGFSDARIGVIYHDTGVDATSNLVGYIDFDVDKSNETGDFTIIWHDDGIFQTS